MILAVGKKAGNTPDKGAGNSVEGRNTTKAKEHEKQRTATIHDCIYYQYNL